MAIVQISKIIHRTGSAIELPQLDIGEVGFASDEQRVFIGNDPEWVPPVGIEPTNTEILTNSPNCQIDCSQLSGVIQIDSDKVTTVYTPGNPGDWEGTPPSTITDAIDRLAALVKTLNNGTGA